MNLRKDHSLSRIILQGLTILAVLAAMAGKVSPAMAAVIPANDEFDNAKKITTNGFSASITDITAATSDPNDPILTCDGGGQGEATLWYTFTPNSSGELSVTTTNSGYDTILTVFKADAYNGISSLIEIGCNDNANTATLTSAMTLALRGGIKYYVEVARKSGSAVSAPDNLRFSFAYSPKAVATPLNLNPILFDGTSTLIKYSTGWGTFMILPGIAYNNMVNTGNNPGNTATFYFDGSGVEVCYVIGPKMGNMNVWIDGALAGVIGQGSGTYQYTCWDSPALPIAGSASLYEDNVHKLVLQHGGGGDMINLDTIEVFPYFDGDAPDPISDLTATTGTSTGKVTLTWSATGDDYSYGRVKRNEIRYSLDPIVDDATWDAASVYSLSQPVPLTAGSKQTVTLSGLAPNVQYYFNVRGVDEAGNMGDLSNEADAVAKAPIAVGPGTYDDTNSRWSYSGSWTKMLNPDDYYNSFHQSSKLGSTALFYFTGTQFRLFYNMAINQGLLDVYVDGAYVTTIDQYNANWTRRTYVSPMLINGPHSVLFVQKSLPFVNIDVIGIFNIVDGGPPDPITNLQASNVGAADDGSVILTWTATGDDPDPPVGRALKYEVRYSTSPILTDADWYAAKNAAGSVPIPQDAGLGETMTVVGLAPGVDYYFAVRAYDDAGYSSMSNSADAVAAVVTLSYSPPGFYEDDDPAWLYSGIWMPLLPPAASGGTIHVSTLQGSSAIFLFNGTGFTLTYEKAGNLGLLQVYVDGVLVDKINQYSSTRKWQVTWTESGLAAGDHTVQFIAGTKATIDAIEILP